MSSSTEPARVILKCVKQGSQLRIRFDYVIKNGEVFQNVYNNQYNCRFPRNIRVEGRRYEIPDTDITLCRGANVPYYIVKKNNIHILEPEKVDVEELMTNMKILNVPTCVVCLENESTMAFLPCDHQCACGECSAPIVNAGTCPLCRRTIAECLQC
jgi:hypothetical protein